MKIAVVGCGVAGSAAALLLAGDGHDVTILDRVAESRPVGAGILLQPLGQRVLAELGLLDQLARRSSVVRRFEGRTRSGRLVLDFAYDHHPAGRGLHGLGVHRADLVGLLSDAVRAAAIALLTGVEVTAVDRVDTGWIVRTAPASLGPYDLVVIADGARSRLRRQLGVASKDVGYPYGAIWSIVPDSGRLAGDVLTQRYDGTRTTLGILPSGVDHATLYWSLPTRAIEPTLAAGAAAWAATARRHAGPLASLVDGSVERGILGARYRDVVVPRPALVSRRSGVVLIGDAAHAMSPQLGLGASLALADAWSLAFQIRRSGDDLAAALEAYVADRRAHVRWYTWLSRIMTPVFQSDLVPVGWPRDLFFGPVGRVPWVRRQFVEMELGCQTSPWSWWSPMRGNGPLAARRSSSG